MLTLTTISKSRERQPKTFPEPLRKKCKAPYVILLAFTSYLILCQINGSQINF